MGCWVVRQAPSGRQSAWETQLTALTALSKAHISPPFSHFLLHMIYQCSIIIEMGLQIFWPVTLKRFQNSTMHSLVHMVYICKGIYKNSPLNTQWISIYHLSQATEVYTCPLKIKLEGMFCFDCFRNMEHRAVKRNQSNLHTSVLKAQYQYKPLMKPFFAALIFWNRKMYILGHMLINQEGTVTNVCWDSYKICLFNFLLCHC